MRIPLYLLIYIALAPALCGALAPSPAAAAELPPVSGLALIEGRDFLFVVDTKANSGDARAGIISVGEEGGYTVATLDITWPAGPSNDLESASPIPGRPGEFLAAESGPWTDRKTGEKHPGRIFHLRVAKAGDGWRSEVLSTFLLPEGLVEVEGIACLGLKKVVSLAYGSVAAAEFEIAGAATQPAAPPEPEKQGWLVVLGERGGGFPYEPGHLWWNYVDLESGEWSGGEPGIAAISSGYSSLNSPWTRGITDIYADPTGSLWLSTAVDPGDGGPFSSYIYRYGSIDGENYYPGAFYTNQGWMLQGLKVEALGAPVLPGSVLSFATDDESYGGIWRPIGAAPGQQFM